jgi:hypothetical protein
LGLTQEAKIISIIAGVIAALGLFCMINILWNNKDLPSYYNQSTKFVVSDIDNPPAGLQKLLEGARVTNGNECERIGKHDVPSCISAGEFPTDGWENRGASLAGAVRVMKQTTGQSQNVDLLNDTLAYIYPNADAPIPEGDNVSDGRWTAIRDGSNLGTPTESIVEWDGTNRPVTCKFEGDFELNRAFRGERSNNFPNLIAEKFPTRRFNRSDVYGYCDHEHGDEPIIVVPMYQNVRYRNRSVATPAGVLLIHGSPSGDPRFEFKTSVKDGEVPGPVYPLSIAETQREEHTWAAGRQYRDRNKFGFDPTKAASQTSNTTEFLLRSRQDGRTYWVSPLTPRGSNSQLVLAYAVIPADTVNGGQLNELTIYVFDQDNPHVVNLDQMERDIRAFVSRQYPGFFSGGGKIQEFIPAAGTKWRAFGVFDDAPYFTVELDPNGTNQPVVTDLANGSTPPSDNPTEEPQASSVCVRPIGEQTNEELVTCAQAVLDELGRRNTTPTASEEAK